MLAGCVGFHGGGRSRERRVPISNRRVAVIDIGSNSGRITVLEVGSLGNLGVVADSRAPLRLERDLQGGRQFSDVTVERTAQVVADFSAIGRSSEVDRVAAVATAAVREAANAQTLLERIHEESGVDVRVITGEEEARYSFAGAVYGLAVTSGIVFDIGGGSLEVTRFKERKPVTAWSLPLGALLLSDRYLRHDPPTSDEVKELRKHVHHALDEIGVKPLERDESLVGTGGTTRNLARIDRHAHTYPLPRLHGYVLTSHTAADVAVRLSERPLARRRSVAGLNPDRADSIVGGALVVQTLMDISASDVIVSGQGLREGIALDAFEVANPSILQTRHESIRALASRFSTWDERRASRRNAIAATLLGAMETDASSATRERLETASTLLDVGRSVDYYRRHRHAADILIEADLVGFSHRELALLAAVIRSAGTESSRWQAYRPLLGPHDGPLVAGEGMLLELADEIEHRMAPGEADSISCEVNGKNVLLTAPVLDPWRQERLQRRFAGVFRKRLHFT
jgi:exopolyphosphatase / guanosine-5'-triphosphate,3'-diphosphate pyrophosphatase